MKEYVLRTNALTKIYGKVPVVDKVSMNVRKGDIYGFIGKNGAGKTTFMRMAAGLAAPNAGSIELFGSSDLVRGRYRMGCTIEQPALYSNMTAVENLEVYRRMYGIPSKDEVERVLGIVELTDTGRKKAKNFSMGMKQRMSIAIALMGNPDFLMLDEPINGLDPSGIKDVRELLARLSQEEGITILLSSHILGELSKIATSYGIINNGRLVEEMTSEQLDEKCKRCLKITVDDTRRAASLLETQLNLHQYDVIDQNTLRIFEHLDAPGEINALLGTNGIMIQSSALAGQDLEGYFMELMGGDGND